MSFSGFFNDLITLQKPGSTDAAQNLSNELDAKILKSNQDLVDRQVWTQAQADAAAVDLGVNNSLQSVDAQTQAQAADGILGYQPLDVAAQEQAVAAQSIKDSVDATASGISKATNWTASSLLGFIWKAVPWWLWVGAAIAAFFYFGGGIILRAEAKKQFGKRYG